MNTKREPDRIFLTLVVILVIFGVFSFVSAALGVYAKDASKFAGILVNQIVFGIGMGILAGLFAYKLNYKIWRKYAFLLFLASLGLTALVFVPGLGFEHGGARRWLSIFGLSIQPAEFLKFSFVVYFAAWLSWVKHRVNDWKFGILPLIVFLGVVATVLLLQPDTKSFLLISVTAFGMLFISGISTRVVLAMTSFVAVGLIIFGLSTSYVRDRIETFIHPNSDPQGGSWQINQSLIAVGSGGIFGRGLGQSVQKFTNLPEPHGDSIFAVIGEEMGFVGTFVLITLYLMFSLRGLRIAYRSPDSFARLLVFGLVILFTVQSFLNISSSIGLFPLTGVPLVFISHGGTSLLVALMSVGLILQISRYQTDKI